MRLLATAKDEDRRKFIQKALVVLDKSPSKSNPTMGKSSYFKGGSHSHLFEVQKVLGSSDHQIIK